jgi:NAD(P)-dependent dehydrogenase (short-subunit alcohol dehydrogenase family)
MMERFADRTVLLTGASGGIGSAIAGRFVEEGATVVGVDLVEAPPDSACVAIEQASITDPAEMAATVAGIEERFGPIDVCIANAAIIARRGRASSTPIRTPGRKASR